MLPELNIPFVIYPQSSFWLMLLLLLIDFYLDVVSPRQNPHPSLYGHSTALCLILKGVDIITIKDNNCTLTMLASLLEGNRSTNPD